MKQILSIAIGLLLGECLCFAAEVKVEPVKIKIGKTTTFIDGPILADGTVDYVTALDQIASQVADPQNNAVVVLVQAIGPDLFPEGMVKRASKQLGCEPPEVGGNYFVSLQNWLVANKQKDEKKVLDQFNELKTTPWKKNEHPEIAKWLDSNQVHLENVAIATSRPNYYMPLLANDGEDRSVVAIMLPALHHYREVARTLAVRAMLHFGEGRYDKAAADCITIHRLGRLMGQEPILISQLVSFAIENTANDAIVVMATSNRLPVKIASILIRDIESLPETFTVRRTINLGERFMALDSTMLVYRRGEEAVRALGFNLGKNGPKGKQITQTFDPNVTLVKLNGLYNQLDAISGFETWAEKKDAWRDFESEFMGNSKKVQSRIKQKEFWNRFSKANVTEQRRIMSDLLGDIIASLVLPALMRTYETELACHTTTQLARVALALSIFHQRNGRYPAKLDELNGLIKIPIDPFDQKPVRYLVGESSYVLYSVGPNMKDDNGTVTPTQRNLDVVIPRPNLESVGDL